MIIAKSNRVYLVEDGQRRLLGIIYPGKKVFRTHRDIRRHLFRAYQGWGFNRELLDYLSSLGIVWVEVEDARHGSLYRTTLRTILERGISYSNNGEEQRVLPLDYWDMRRITGNLEKWLGGEAA